MQQHNLIPLENIKTTHLKHQYSVYVLDLNQDYLSHLEYIESIPEKEIS